MTKPQICQYYVRYHKNFMIWQLFTFILPIHYFPTLIFLALLDTWAPPCLPAMLALIDHPNHRASIHNVVLACCRSKPKRRVLHHRFCFTCILMMRYTHREFFQWIFGTMQYDFLFLWQKYTMDSYICTLIRQLGYCINLQDMMRTLKLFCQPR